ncbi:hypothetical protein DQ04_12441000, partial [Trypanosoma grayi]|uniref:hypothetical protein n=1 Tax=Trypanosoma grayi TaxID=71804 RepID=UPI0004F48075
MQPAAEDAKASLSPSNNVDDDGAAAAATLPISPKADATAVVAVSLEVPAAVATDVSAAFTPVNDSDSKTKGSSARDRVRADEDAARTPTIRQKKNNAVPAGESNLTPRKPKTRCPVPYSTGRRRTNLLVGASNYWHTQEEVRTIGVGTVGLYQDMPHDTNVPDGARACINGNVIVGSSAHIRKLKEYLEWRDRHNALFATMREQDEKERQEKRRRRLLARARRREEEDGEYTAAVARLRRRGWSVLGDTPRQTDSSRHREIKAQRDAFRAECEESTLRRIQAASKLREDIGQQLATYKEEQQRQQELVRDASRTEREHMQAKRQQNVTLLKEKAETLRAERDAEREFQRECAAAEEKYRRHHLATLRERVNAKLQTPGLGSTWSSTLSGTGGAQYPPGDWRNTFRSPLHTLPNASDDAYRKQWMAQLQEERIAVARADVELIRRTPTPSARDTACRNNCERAEALRGERE